MPIPGQPAIIERRLARDETYATLREWIVSGTLAPGEKVRDGELAAALGVSRMPVREALLRLEDEGLVETAANRWTRVAPLDLGQARELYPLVWSLEALAVELLPAPLTPAELAAMTAANARLGAALAAHEPAAASQADHTFHQVYIERAANAELLRVLAELKTKLRRLEIAYFDGCAVADRAVVEHQRIIAALAADQRNAAAEAVRANWAGSLARFTAVAAGA